MLAPAPARPRPPRSPRQLATAPTAGPYSWPPRQLAHGPRARRASWPRPLQLAPTAGPYSWPPGQLDTRPPVPGGPTAGQLASAGAVQLAGPCSPRGQLASALAPTAGQRGHTFPTARPGPARNAFSHFAFRNAKRQCLQNRPPQCLGAWAMVGVLCHAQAIRGPNRGIPKWCAKGILRALQKGRGAHSFRILRGPIVMGPITLLIGPRFRKSLSGIEPSLRRKGGRRFR